MTKNEIHERESKAHAILIWEARNLKILHQRRGVETRNTMTNV